MAKPEFPGGQYSTFTRHKPLAGAVAPAAARERASIIFVRSDTVREPFPASKKVPTRLRTMWCRNPLPRTV